MARAGRGFPSKTQFVGPIGVQQLHPLVSATAGLASGTGAALTPSVAVNPSAGLATGTGTALTPTATVSPNAALATGVGAARGAAISAAAGAGLATGTVAALAPSANVGPNAGLATGIGAALTATVGVPAGIATGIGAALTPSISVAPNAALATGTGAALGVGPLVSPAAGLATGIGAALAPSITIGAGAGLATGTGAAQAPTAAVSPNAGIATGTGAALDVTLLITPSAIAGIATGTGAALTPATAVAASAGLASGTGAALGAVAATGPNAGLATGTGAALAPTISISPNAGLAQGTVAALGPSASIAGSAGLATGVGVALGAGVSVVYAPRGLTGAVEYVAELFDSGGTFGPSTKLGEIWDFRNLGWSRYDRLPGKGFMTLYQDSPHLSKLSPLVTHIRVTRVAPSADVEVYNGQLIDYDSTGDDVILTCFDYVSLFAISRSGYRTLYPTKLLGTEIAQVEAQAAINKLFSPLGFVAMGTVEDPLGVDGVTKIKTNAEFGLLDQMRLQVLYDLSEMGRANTTNHVSFEVSRVAPFTFNFWKNKGTLLGMGMILNGNVSDYQYLPNWGSYRNDLASLGTTVGGGATEITKTNEAAAAARGRRQDVATIKTVLGITSSAVEADQQQAATARMLQVAVQKMPALSVRLVRNTLVPFTGWDINDKVPVEIVNGIDNITAPMRLVGVRGLYTEAGEDLGVILEPVLT